MCGVKYASRYTLRMVHIGIDYVEAKIFLDIPSKYNCSSKCFLTLQTDLFSQTSCSSIWAIYPAQNPSTGYITSPCLDSLVMLLLLIDKNKKKHLCSLWFLNSCRLTHAGTTWRMIDMQFWWIDGEQSRQKTNSSNNNKNVTATRPKDFRNAKRWNGASALSALAVGI